LVGISGGNVSEQTARTKEDKPKGHQESANKPRQPKGPRGSAGYTASVMPLLTLPPN